MFHCTTLVSEIKNSYTSHHNHTLKIVDLHGMKYQRKKRKRKPETEYKIPDTEAEAEQEDLPPLSLS